MPALLAYSLHEQTMRPGPFLLAPGSPHPPHRMQDQLIIYMALARGTSWMVCAEPTLHTRTAMVVAEAMLPGVKFRVGPATGGDSKGGCKGGSGGLYLVECEGAGVVAGRG